MLPLAITILPTMEMELPSRYVPAHDPAKGLST